MKNKIKRNLFSIRLLPENYEKMKIESDKLWLTASAFISFLIKKYVETKVEFDFSSTWDIVASTNTKK